MRYPLICLVIVCSLPAVVHGQAKGPRVPEGVTFHKDLGYGNDERNKLDVFVPKSDKPVPLIIWIHGGGWQAGDKYNPPALPMLERGYAVASINYRFSQKAVFPAQIQDCKAAICYLRENAEKLKVNPDRFGVWGGSAGGHLVSLLGNSAEVKALEGDNKKKTSTAVQCVVNWFGPTDLIKLSPPRSPANPVTSLLGGSTDEKAELAKLANPITHVSKKSAPHLIFHGDRDPLVPLSQSEMLHEALKKADVESELIVFKRAGHGDREFTTQFMEPDNLKKLYAFFDKHLKK